jgi:hypothetical protein
VPGRALGVVLLLGGLGLVATLTLVPLPEQAAASSRTPITCLWCGDRGTIDVVLNLLLFAPLGAGLALLGIAPRRALVGMALVSLAVESVQFAAIPGRDASLSDLLTNTAGGGLGLLLARSWSSWILCGPVRARGLAFGAGAVWLFLALLSCLALRPAATSLQYYGQIAPELGDFTRYLGDVVTASADGVPVREGPLEYSGRVRAALDRGAFMFSARTLLGPIPVGLAPIVRIADADYSEIALLAQDGGSLVFRVRLSAARLGLRVPGVRLGGVFPPGAGLRRDVEGIFDGRSLAARVREGSTPREWRVLLGPHLGWALWLPVRFELRAGTAVLDALWIGAWFALCGWWLGRWPARRTMSRPLVVAVLAITSLGLIPAGFGFAPSPLHAWVAAALGAATGVLLASSVLARLGPPTGLHS